MQRVVSLLPQHEGRSAHRLQCGLQLLDGGIWPVRIKPAEGATSRRAGQHGKQLRQFQAAVRRQRFHQMVNALEKDADLSALRGYAEDSGEGRWTVQAAVDHAVPLPVITSALFARFSSRQDDSPAMKMIAALRNQFGGHAVTSRAGSTEKGADSPGADAGAEAGHDPAEGRERGEPGKPPGA